MILRQYQSDLFERVRAAFSSGARRVCLCLPTGGGKTAIFSLMTAASQRRGGVYRVWIVVPRDELLRQASESLTALGVAHGVIAAGRAESLAYAVHVVSSATLSRRWDKIKHPPDFLIVDEAHLHYDRQAEIQQRFPACRIVGVTASPERLDGRGLSDLYDVLVEGPSIVELTEAGYLAPITDYYAPQIEGLDGVRRASNGYDYDADELESLLARRKVYGSALEHYQRYAHGRSALVFVRSIKSAEDVAHRFSAAGYTFEPISSRTPTRERVALVDGLRDGRITGLVNCEIATYGLDVPRVSCIVLLRPTLSKALQVQMIGRGLRTAPGKKDCVVLDHVGILAEHRHPYAPHAWAFHSTERRKRQSDPTIRLRLCPETWLYCEKSSCVGCKHNTTGRKTRAEHVVDCQLQRVEAPVALAERPVEEQREYQDRLGSALDRAWKALDAGQIDSGAIGEMLALAKQIGRQPMWVYWRLCEGRLTVNVQLLHEIERQCGYKRGWAFFKQREIVSRLQSKQRRTA
jgi:DNA repair protein RadD